MKKMKFYRFARRFFKYSLFLAIIVSTAKLLEFIDDQRRENKRRERRRHIALSVLACLATVAGTVTAAWAALREIRRRRGGYLFDLFDRDNYDVVSPDEEDKYSDIIKGELNREDDGASNRKIHTARIPLDDETTAEDF